MIYGFRLVTGRTPNADELSVLLTGYGQDLQAFRAEPERAIQLLRNGDSGIPEDGRPRRTRGLDSYRKRTAESR